VQGAANVGDVDERRDRTRFGARDLAMCFAHLRGNEREPGEPVELLLARDRDGDAARVVHGVAVERVATRCEAFADPAHVGVRSRRTPEGDGEFVAAHAVQVELRAVHVSESRRGGVSARHGLHARRVGERRGHGARIAADGDDVGITDRLAMPPHGARELGALHARMGSHGTEHRARLRHAAMVQRAVAGRAHEGDPLEDALRRLRAEALHLRQPPVERRRLE